MTVNKNNTGFAGRGHGASLVMCAVQRSGTRRYAESGAGAMPIRHAAPSAARHLSFGEREAPEGLTKCRDCI